MKEIKRYQVRGIPGSVIRADFSGRTVDFWAPKGGSDHVLVAHDGQNIFDRKTATFLYTWRLAQTSLKIASDLGKKPPLIIGIFHSSTKKDPHGRSKDLCPEDPFREGILSSQNSIFPVDELRGNSYLQTIFDEIMPSIATVTATDLHPSRTAMIGSSMGGLATLYSSIKFPERFSTALALSPHWLLAGFPLVEWMIPKLPKQNHFRIWMSRGTKGLDSQYLPFQDHANHLMDFEGWDKRSFTSKVFHRTTHNERSWASYVHEPIRFWLSQGSR